VHRPAPLPARPNLTKQPVVLSRPLAQPVAQPPSAERHRPWYAEPVVLGTIVVLMLVVIAFVVLLNSAFGTTR
jgi:hypothetical protein